jgi:mRNA-degrading endonuclease RelE of RelBE toxin-antitoxin system
MSWKIEIKPTAEKSYLKLDKKTRRRIKRSLLELEKSENPLMHPNVRPLIGKLRSQSGRLESSLYSGKRSKDHARLRNPSQRRRLLKRRAHWA